MTPKLRFPEFTHDWLEASLQDEYDYKNAKAHEPYVDENGRYKLINSKFISTEGKKFKTVDRVLTKGSVGDVTMVLSDLPNGKALAKAYYVEEDDTYAINQRICRLRVLDEQKNDSKFFYYLINRNSYFLRLDDGITQTHISKGDVLNFRYYTTQLNEQTRIRDLFNCVDQKINLLSKKKEALETYKKGLMQKIFSQELRFKREDGTDYPEWKRVRIGDVFTVTRGKVLATSLTKQESEEGYIYPVYSSQTKMNGLMGFYDEFLFSDAITWTTDGANAGEVKFRKDKFYCTNVCGVLLSDKYANTAVSIAINRVTHKYVSYVGNPKLMNGVMSEIALLLPTSSEEMNRISGLFEKLEDEISVIQKRIEAVNKLKQGLLQQMFV